MEQIKELSPYSSHYIIPHNQKKARRHGLILYNSADRSGAEVEAQNLKQALETAGNEVIKMEWSSANELHSMIESAVGGILDKCSLLVVCLMAHGSRGVIQGEDGSKI